MVKTRKNRRMKKGGGNNWRPTRSAKRPIYLNSQRNIDKIIDDIIDHNRVDLSKYQKALIVGTDSQKKDAIRDLKIIKYNTELRKHMLNMSKPLAVTMLLTAPIGFLTGSPSMAMLSVKDSIHALKKDAKMEYNELIKAIDTLLESSNVEETTHNPLLHIKESKKT